MGFARSFSLRRKQRRTLPPEHHKGGSLSGDVFPTQTPEEVAAARRARSKPFGSVDLSQYMRSQQKSSHRRVEDAGEQRMSVNPLRAHPHGFEDPFKGYVPTPFPQDSPHARSGLPIGVALGDPTRTHTRKPSAPHKFGFYNDDLHSVQPNCFRDSEVIKHVDIPQQKQGRWGKLGGILRKKESKPAFSSKALPPPPPRPVVVQTPPREAELPNFSSTSSEFAEQLRLELDIDPSCGIPRTTEPFNTKHDDILPSPGTATDHFLEEDVPLPLNIPPKRAPILDIEIPDTSMERYSVMFADVLGPNPRTSLLARRHATLDKRRSKRSIFESTLPPAPPQEDNKQRPGMMTSHTLSERSTRPSYGTRNSSRDSRSFKQPKVASRASSKDRRPSTVRHASIRSSVKALPPRLATESITPMPTVARYVQPTPSTPEEVPSLSIIASPTSTTGTKSPETPGKRPIHHERSSSAPSIISPIRATFEFDSMHHSTGDKNGQIMVIVHSPVKESSEAMSPIKIQNSIVNASRISLTPNRLDFFGNDIFGNENESRQTDTSGEVKSHHNQDHLKGNDPDSLAWKGSNKVSADQVSIARQISLRRRELLKPIVRKNEQLRIGGRSETERVAEAWSLKPCLVDLDSHGSRRSQRASLEYI
jgi:hypothetical protein